MTDAAPVMPRPLIKFTKRVAKVPRNMMREGYRAPISFTSSDDFGEAEIPLFPFLEGT